MESCNLVYKNELPGKYSYYLSICCWWHQDSMYSIFLSQSLGKLHNT